jgi:hypothetical protein
MDKEIVKEKKLPRWVYWVWLISIVALCFSFASIFSRYSIKWNIEIVSTSIILTFIGIIATFIVVGNYVQVIKIENQFNERIKEIEDNFDVRTEALKTIFNSRLKDDECKLSSFVHYHRAIAAKKTRTSFRDFDYVNAFDGYVYAIASWDDASNIHIELISKSIDGIAEIKEKTNVKVIADGYESVDVGIMEMCIKVLYSVKVNNTNKHEVVKFIQDLIDHVTKKY